VGHHRTGDVDILVKVPKCDKKDGDPDPSPTFGVIGGGSQPGTMDNAVDEPEPTATATPERPGPGQSGGAGGFFDPIVEVPLPAESPTPASCGGTCNDGSCTSECGTPGCADSGDCGGGCVGGCADDAGCDADAADCGGCTRDCDGGESKPMATPTSPPTREPAVAATATAHDGCPPWMQEAGQCGGGTGR
jgi:hypothetical protein